MSNLIITIISIAIVGIAAAMGIYYGGVAFENAQINAIASTIINEAQQILTAERMWAVNNNQPDISGMGTNWGSGTTGMSELVSSKMLSEWPPLGGTLGVNSSLSNPGPQPDTFNTATGEYDNGYYSINGYSGEFDRDIFSYNNGNYVVYYFKDDAKFWNGPTDASQANHPIVKIAKAINAALNEIPANADMSMMPYVGLPSHPNNSSPGPQTSYDASNGFISGNLWVDQNNVLQTNYCFTFWNSFITCVFGPS